MEESPRDLYAELREQNGKVLTLIRSRLPEEERQVVAAQKRFEELSAKTDAHPQDVKNAKFDLAKAIFKVELTKEKLRRHDSDPEKAIIGKIDIYPDAAERKEIQNKILAELGFDMSINYFDFDY